jgi:hypothetical protein
MVAEVRESQSPAGHQRWGLRLEITMADDDQFVGRTACWDTIHWSERGQARARYILNKLGINTPNQMETYQARDILFREALVTIITEEIEDPILGIRRQTNRIPFAGWKTCP